MPTHVLSSTTRRGYLFLNSHPVGAAATVDQQWAEASSRAHPPAGPAKPPTVLVIGSSAGYGQAVVLSALARLGANGLGVCYERPATAKRSATAGWYRTSALANIAAKAGYDWHFVNSDAFSTDTKDTVVDQIEKRWGGIDYLVYSIAAPRRTDPATNESYTSVIKPCGSPYQTQTIAFDRDNRPTMRSVEIEPASEEETYATTKVMGGEDWQQWVAALAARGLLRDGFTTVGLTYVGSELTAPIYRQGTIGAAKEHLEATAHRINESLTGLSGNAASVVFGAAVTQASTAIPGISLYTSLLADVLGDQIPSPIAQADEMWRQLFDPSTRHIDEHGRIRLDTWELDPAVQARIEARWSTVTTADLHSLWGLQWFDQQVLQLYGFAVPGIDYAQPVDLDQPWPDN